MIQLQFTLQSRELTALTRRKRLRWMRWLYWPAGILLVLLVLFGQWTSKWQGLFLFGIPMVILIVWHELFFPRQMDRMYRKLPSWGKPVQYTFEDDRITQKSAHSETVMQWEAFRKAEELPDWFLLQTGPMVYVSIPKRAFADARAQTEFRELLSRKLLLKD